MIGIVSYGGYIPRLRLNRMSIFQNIGWLAPAIVMVAQGERSMCNWDEDSLTMAVAASRDCLSGTDKAKVDGLYLASTTLPFADRLNAGIVATALNLRDDILTADFTSSLKAGTLALVTGLEVIKSGEKKRVLVTASDRREAKAASFYEMWYGDGAASLLLGDGGEDVIAELKGATSVSYDFVDHYRGARQRFNYTWEERWVREEGYGKIIPEAINRLLSKLGISMDEVDRVVYPCFIKRQHGRIARIIGATPEKVADNLHEVCGETGTAHPLVMLVHALEEAQPGECILVAGFGQGCDALCFEVTENIRNLQEAGSRKQGAGSRKQEAESGITRTGIKGALANRKSTDNYLKFLKFRDLIVTETGIRAEAPNQTAMTALWRKRKMILGLVGGKCKECGTPQFPRMDVCVNPACGAMHSQEDYEFADVLATISLPYISTELRGLEEKVHVKRQSEFQHVLEPVKTKAKQALVDPVGAVNEPGFALSNDKQTEAYHPDVGQARCNQEPTDADGVREMTFVNVKTTTFLVGEEGFDTKAALVEPAGQASIGQIRDQVDGLFVGGSPPRHQIERQRCFFGESDLVGSHEAPLLLGIGAHFAPDLPLPNQNVGGRPQHERPIGLGLHPIHHLRVVILPIAQQDHFGPLWDERHHFLQHFHVHSRRSMPFLAFVDHPSQRQCPLAIDDSYHQHHTATPDSAPIHRQNQGRTCQCRQYLPGKRHVRHFYLDLLVLDPAPHTHLGTFLFRFRRHFSTHHGQLGFVAHYNAGNHHRQGYNVALSVHLELALECSQHFGVYSMSVSHVVLLFVILGEQKFTPWLAFCHSVN